MEQKDKGSRAYLISIVMVAVLGGLLFGYDTAVISGAEKGLQAFFMGADDFVYTDFWHGFTSSSALVGCIIGSAISGLLASNWGRKRSLIFAGVMFFISAWGSMCPETMVLAKGEPNLTLLIVFNIYRVIGGIGVGLASAVCPMYIGEIAPSNIRGMLVSWNQFAIIFGQLVVYFVNFFILGDHIAPAIQSIGNGMNEILNGGEAAWAIETGWRYMFGSEMVPAGLFALLICFVPETPRYLALIGQDEKAERVLARINGATKAREILDEIKNTVSEKKEKLMTYGFLCIFVGVMLSVFQQAVGINAVLYYAPRIYEAMGFDNPMMLTVFNGIVNLETRSQTASHRRFARHGDRSHRCGFHLRQSRCPTALHDIHHGVFSLVYVLLGAHLLGTHRRGVPQHHTWSGSCHRRSLPVDIQLDSVNIIRADGQQSRLLVHLWTLWSNLYPCRLLCMATCSRNQG